MAKKYLRKSQVAARYGVTPRSIENMLKDGRLPPPEYPVGNKTPLWNEEVLDAAERAAVRRTKKARVSTKPEATI